MYPLEVEDGDNNSNNFFFFLVESNSNNFFKIRKVGIEGIIELDCWQVTSRVVATASLTDKCFIISRENFNTIILKNNSNKRRSKSQLIIMGRGENQKICIVRL